MTLRSLFWNDRLRPQLGRLRRASLLAKGRILQSALGRAFGRNPPRRKPPGRNAFPNSIETARAVDGQCARRIGSIGVAAGGIIWIRPEAPPSR
jgi:hypothetical protein